MTTLTILIMLVKFGNPLSSAEKSAMTMRYLLTFNPKEFARKRQNTFGGIATTLAVSGSSELPESSEEEKFVKKQEHNKVLADLQIQEILQTLMSVSVIVTPGKLQLNENENERSDSLSFESSSNINHSALDDSESEPDEDALFHGKMNEWTNLYKPKDHPSDAQNIVDSGKRGLM